ncbi:hypothetical protein LSUE1_G008716 [Lachnellula suecica]|uniref:Uncharacterized protein n=1 Tax=Lachnellula suecica TaxID=602035 RepID=A0A8T9BWD6_9HELO|nr:hypothetical protein LSUE1_G008716 [Lachnellula suecica]
MSLLYRASRFAASRQLVARPARTFTSSSVRALKETDRHNPEAAEHNEKHKQDGLQKQKEGKGHWKPELASDSEEAVAADKSGDHGSIEEMQKKTAEHAEKKHK